MTESVKAWCLKKPDGQLFSAVVDCIPAAVHIKAIELYGYRSWRMMYKQGFRCCRVQIRELEAEVERLNKELSKGAVSALEARIRAVEGLPRYRVEPLIFFW